MNISKKHIAVNSIAHTVYSHFVTPKILNDLNDRDLNDRIKGLKNDNDP